MLSSRVALITGAASGLGRASAERFLEQGASVIFCDLPSSAGAEVVQALGSAKAIFVPTDVTTEADVTHALDVAEKTFGKSVNVAVNCAGVGLAKRTLSKKGPHALEDFEHVLKVNTCGTFNVTRLVAARSVGRVCVIQIDEGSNRPDVMNV